MAQLSKAAINKIKDYDTRNLLLGMYNELDSLHQTTGTSFLQPVNQTQRASSQVPPAPSVSASGANGSISLTITPPSQSLNRGLYFEVSYSPSSNFSSAVTTMPATSATHLVIPAPGAQVYIRVRASYDQKNWSNFAYA